MAFGPQGQFGTAGKNRSMAGLGRAQKRWRAAELAAAGMTGRLDILEWPAGVS